MAYLQTAALITRIGEVIEDSRGAKRTVPTGRFSGTFPQGLSESTQQRKSLVNPRVRVNVNTIGRSQYSPPINGDLIIYDIEAIITASRILTREQQINSDDYDTVQAAGAEDTDVIRQALEWPDNLKQTEAGAVTDLVSGMLAHVSSSFAVIGQVDQGAQRLEGTHVFKGWMISRPEV